MGKGLVQATKSDPLFTGTKRKNKVKGLGQWFLHFLVSGLLNVINKYWESDYLLSM